MNIVGLRRNQFPPELRLEIQKAYKILYRSGYNVSQAIEEMEKVLDSTPEIEHFLRFCVTPSAASAGNGGDDGMTESEFIGLIAGNGALPVEFAKRAAARGFRVLAIGATPEFRPR